MTDFSKTNIHCSSIGNIMSNGRGRKSPLDRWQQCTDKVKEYNCKYELLDDKKRAQTAGAKMLAQLKNWEVKLKEAELVKDSVVLSTGAMSHLKKVYAYAKYHKWSAGADKGSKQTNKGVIAENSSVELICRLEDKQYIKNEERVENEFLTGIPDLFMGDNIYNAQYIIDVKTSWDIETFLNTLGKPLDNKYWWQIQGYVAITGAKLGEVSYCLVNTPESLLNHERYKLKERLDSVTEEDPVYKLAEYELVNNMTFDDIPEKDRRIRFLVERDDEAIEQVYKKVAKCREYLAEIEELHMQGTFLAKTPTQDEESEENLEETEE